MARAYVVYGAVTSGQGALSFLSYASSTLAGCWCAKSRSYEWVKKYDGLYCRRGQRSVGKELSLFSSTLWAPLQVTNVPNLGVTNESRRRWQELTLSTRQRPVGNKPFLSSPALCPEQACRLLMCQIILEVTRWVTKNRSHSIRQSALRLTV